VLSDKSAFPLCNITTAFTIEPTTTLTSPLWAGKDAYLNTAYQNSTPTANPVPPPPLRVVERKIGKATFIVSSRFSDGKEKDIVSTIARLVQHESGKPV
jgi:hypothetical protein